MYNAGGVDPQPIKGIIHIAGPFFGSPKAYFVVHPKMIDKVGVLGGFLETFLLNEAWNWLATPGDKKDLEAELKNELPLFDSTFELMPDEFYVSAQQPILKVNNYKGQNFVPIGSAIETYGYNLAEGAASRENYMLPSSMNGLVSNAMQFKHDLGDKIPKAPIRNLFIYNDKIKTQGFAEYHVYANSLKDIQDFPDKGDGTVTTVSAKGPPGANPEQVDGTHSELPNSPDTFAKIKFFIQQSP